MYYVSDKKEKLQIVEIKKLLEQTYWANQRSIEVIEKSIENSLCFGVYREVDDKQVAFARVITDYATSYYICDVIVDEAYRGKAVGKTMLAAITSDKRLTGLRGILCTADAHGLYQKYGFCTDNGKFMNREPSTLPIA